MSGDQTWLDRIFWHALGPSHIIDAGQQGDEVGVMQRIAGHFKDFAARTQASYAFLKYAKVLEAGRDDGHAPL